MNGGILEQMALESDGVFLQVNGVGCYRHKMTILKIPPTNYRLRAGDLLWWQSGKLYWEGNRQVVFECQGLEAMSVR